MQNYGDDSVYIYINCMILHLIVYFFPYKRVIKN